jgi:hypothetical protein
LSLPPVTVQTHSFHHDTQLHQQQQQLYLDSENIKMQADQVASPFHGDFVFGPSLVLTSTNSFARLHCGSHLSSNSHLSPMEISLN